MPAEVEFCELAAALVALHKPGAVIETGVGQGYTTRRLAAAIGAGEVFAYESDPDWRAALAMLDFWTERVHLAGHETPDPETWALCEMAVLDSGEPYRIRELQDWASRAPFGSIVLCHDTWNEEGDLVRAIRDLGISGVFMSNPRGSFLGQK